MVYAAVKSSLTHQLSEKEQKGQEGKRFTHVFVIDGLTIEFVKLLAAWTRKSGSASRFLSIFRIGKVL
jgi:hypothetical protein